MSTKPVERRPAVLSVLKKKLGRTKPARKKSPTAKNSSSSPKYSYILRLFVAGASARSSEAIQHVRELCATELKGSGKLEVIDIYQQPALARANQIVATPTLIIVFPPPLRRFIGNMANVTGLLVQLAVSPKGKIKI